MDNLQISDVKKKYIHDKVTPVLEEMVTDVITNMPEDPKEYMLEWLKAKSGSSSGGSDEVAKLKEELKIAESKLAAARKSVLVEHHQGDEEDSGSEEEEDSDDDDWVDEIPDSFKQSEAGAGRARTSVSAEVYGNWNKMTEFTPPVFKKSPDQKARIKQTMSDSWLFQNLADKDLAVVVDALQEMIVKQGSCVIKQGDDGDFMFVIESGHLDCVKPINGKDTVVKTCEAGDAFGELALLYNVPRAASVVAKDNCILWKLDRKTFNHVVQQSAQKRRDKYEQFIKDVNLLSGLDAYDVSQLCDAFKETKFDQGQTIITQGEDGNTFYVVEEGAAAAFKDGKQVMEYHHGNYFGELALLRNEPRAATVKAISDCTVLSLDRKAFKRLLPMEKLTANMARYN